MDDFFVGPARVSNGVNLGKKRVLDVEFVLALTRLGVWDSAGRPVATEWKLSWASILPLLIADSEYLDQRVAGRANILDLSARGPQASPPFRTSWFAGE